MEDVQWRDEIENLYGLRVCAIIQLIFGVVMSLASAWAMRGQCVGNALHHEMQLMKR